MFYAGFVPREKGTQLTRSVGRRLRKSKTREVNRQQSEISIKSNRKVNTVFGVVKQLACKQQFPTPSKHLCPEPWNMILYISVMLIICSQLLWTRFFFWNLSCLALCEIYDRHSKPTLDSMTIDICVFKICTTILCHSFLLTQFNNLGTHSQITDNNVA